jgi:Asp-tRNA(Asn)/Glu-tRNA(Gln) amidotransferase A subunit family amidase
LGVPLSIKGMFWEFMLIIFLYKDHIEVKGVKLTIGLPCFANNPAMEDDAELVKR